MEAAGYQPIGIILISLAVLIGGVVLLVLAILMPFYVYRTACWAKKAVEWLSRCHEELTRISTEEKTRLTSTPPPE